MSAQSEELLRTTDQSSAEFEAIKRRLRRSTNVRFAQDAFPLVCYFAYSIFHLFTFPILAIRGLLVAEKRGYSGMILKRLLGGSKPPRKARWTILACGGLGEVRVGWTFSEKVAAERDNDVAVIVKSNNQVQLQHTSIHMGILPFSNPISVAIFLLRWRPKAILAVEFFVNHHLAGMCAVFNIPTVNFNVPVTERDAKQITFKRRWRQQLVSASFCQSEAHRNRLIEYARVSPDAVAVTGPVCIAVDPVQGLELTQVEVKEKYRGLFKIDDEDFPIIIAGSTYHVEEVVVLEAFDRLLVEFPRAVLILAPRGVTRREGCDSAILEAQKDYVRRTVPFDRLSNSRIVLLDVTGELRYVYSVGDIALVGGSYRTDGTGHTPVEAAAWGLPITIGPNYPQQTTIVELLQGIDAIEICPDADSLANAWIELSKDDHRRAVVKERLEAFLERSDGAVLDIYDTILGA